MQLTLIDKKRETADVTSFIFKSEEPIYWKAGQYMRYIINDPGNPENMNRFFTISNAPFEGNIMLTTKFMPNNTGSVFKRDLAKMSLSQTIEATGPFGAFVVDDPNQEFVFIAGGIGITPFRSIILQMDHDKQPLNMILLYANRTEEIVFKDEFEAIAKRNPGFKIHYFVGEKKIDEEALKSLIVASEGGVYDPQSLIYYISGPQAMVRVMESLVSSLGVPEEKIIHDYFPGYADI